ncbi:CGNR zinc finger domain-containing protein [Dactylosporangium sp. CA-152071]|uniref:CGNR zinc finger domain-containing protein n=1 Tax=Dactylosporangium sp. CA-152071 TaxID=3239933 RepID=UPI003D8AD244
MARLDGLGAGEARRFRTGRMALDLVHTAGDREHGRVELLSGPAELGRWLGVVTGLDPIVATGVDIDPVHALRHAVRRAAARTMAKTATSVVDRLALNAAAAITPPVPELRADGAAAVRGVVRVPEVLSLLARDAIELFGGPLAAHVRMCGGCGLLYVEPSPGGCSPRRCAGRVRVSRLRSA